MTLTEFLLARIAEDEAVALTAEVSVSYHRRWAQDADGSPAVELTVAPERQPFQLARVLATCAAIRQIVEHGPSQCADYEVQAEYGSHHYPDPEWAFCDGCSAAESCDIDWKWTLRTLATIYADHPDYEWQWRL